MSRRARKTVLADAPRPRKRAVSYRRASTNEANQPHSLHTQDSETKRFIDREGWELVGDYEEYASGKDQNRQKLKELLRDAKNGLFDVVVVQRIDHLARNLGDLLLIMKEFDQYGVSFYSVHERFESETVSGRLLIQIIGALAEFERRLLLERIQGGQRTKVVEKGLPLSRSRAPFGTRVNETTGVLEKDELTDEEGNVIGGTWQHVQSAFEELCHPRALPHDNRTKPDQQGSPDHPWERLVAASHP